MQDINKTDVILKSSFVVVDFSSSRLVYKEQNITSSK